MLASPLSALPHSRKMTLFTLLLLTNFVSMLDVHSVSTALTYILQDIGGNESIGWLTAAYMIAQCSVMPIYGKMGDMFGRKPALIISILMFSLGAILCASATSFGWLIAARLIQGAGSGGIVVSVFSINGEMFEARERAKYQSLASLVLVVASALGPFIGGILADTFGWRAVFLVGLPIAALSLFALWRVMPSTPKGPRRQIDVLGAISLTITISAVVLLADSAHIFKENTLLGAASIALAGLVAFTVWIKAERRAAEPIVSLELFKIKGFPYFLGLAALNGALAIALVTYHALYLQMSTGLAPSKAGLFFICITAGLSLGSLTAGQIISRTGHLRGVILVSMAANICSLSLLALLPFPDTPFALLAVAMAFQGMSVGFAQQAPILGIQSIAPREHLGAATSTVTLMRTAGAAIAVATYSAVLVAGLKSFAGGNIGEIIIAIRNDNLLAIETAGTAFTTVYGTAACIAVVGLLAALRLPVRKT